MTLRILCLALSLAAPRFVDARADADAGRILYQRHCADCHGPEARGDGPTATILTRPPGDLRDSELWKSSSDEAVARWVLDGRKLRLELRPEALHRQARETEAIYQFLRRLPSIDWPRVEAGQSVYLDRCLPCHDAYGRPQANRPAGVRGSRDLSDPAFQSALDDADLIRRVRHGQGGMPALLPRVSKRDAAALLAYVRILSPGYELYDRYCLSCHGPHGEGATGPLADFSGPGFAFDQAWLSAHTPDEIRAGVWHMLREKNQWMPHYRGVLDERAVRQILSWLRSLGPRQ